MMTTTLALAASFLPLLQVDPDRAHIRIARKVAPAVVFVEGGRQRGSGVIVDPSGVILTSTTACGVSSTTVQVITQGNRSHRGRVLGRAPHLELVVVKIDPADPLPAVELGDSDRARVGQTSYVFGDSFDSLSSDDQAAMSLGVISGIYSLSQRHGEAQYTGRVLETSAAVNPNQDGGPLVDREGKLLGLITLNYDDSKFTGLAIPINVLKPAVEQIRKEHRSTPVVLEAPKAPAEEAWAGLEVKEAAGGLEVVRVSRKGPADLAGLRKGDVIALIDGVRPPAEATLWKMLAKRAPGETLRFTLEREDGGRAERTVTLAKRPVY
jgi:S1-C subfamily serine protease